MRLQAPSTAALARLPDHPHQRPPPWLPCSREKLFNVIVGCFLAFYGGFALLYPHHDALHLTGLADKLVNVLPAGLSGGARAGEGPGRPGGRKQPGGAALVGREAGRSCRTMGTPCGHAGGRQRAHLWRFPALPD